VAGIVALTKAGGSRDLPLAAVPIIFSLQQTIEGLLWLNLPLAPSNAASTNLTHLYLLLAEVLWPIYAPIAVLLVEPSARRRQLMLICLAAGICAGAYLLWWILARPHSAVIRDGHIVYTVIHGHSAVVALAYFVATVVPLLLSSRRTLVVLGAIMFAGYAVSYLFYREAFVSVWCYFAAAASLVILGHFELARRQRLRMSDA